MIYLNNTTNPQDVYIPRQDRLNVEKTGIDLSAYLTSGETQEMIDNSLSGYATEQWVENQGYLTEHQSLSAYSTTVQVEEMIASAKSEIEQEIPEIPTSNTAFTNDAGYITSGDAQEQIDEAISGIPTEFKTINNESIIGTGNITISAGTTYSAGTNIDITNNIISVTGITIPTSNTAFTNDAGYITSGDAQTQIDNSLSGYATEQWVENQGYLTEHQSLSAYSTTDEVETMISGATEDFVTSGEVQTQIDEAISGIDLSNYYTSAQTDAAIAEATVDLVTSAETEAINNDIAILSGKVQTNEQVTAAALVDLNSKIPDVSDFVTSGEVQTQIDEAISGIDLSNYYTSAQTDTAITEATSGKQDTLISGTNIKTINNQSLLGSGNIDIQGGGSGSESVVELTKAQYEALSAYAPDTTYIITDAEAVDLNDFATSGDVADLEEDLATVSAATETKATKASTTARSNGWWPSWNAEGIITGGTQAYAKSHNINGTNYNTWSNSNTNWPTIYAPTSAGTSGQIVTSNGSGAPSWTSFKFWFGTQDDYDAISTKDSACIYFITD